MHGGFILHFPFPWCSTLLQSCILALGATSLWHDAHSLQSLGITRTVCQPLNYTLLAVVFSREAGPWAQDGDAIMEGCILGWWTRGVIKDGSPGVFYPRCQPVFTREAERPAGGLVLFFTLTSIALWFTVWGASSSVGPGFSPVQFSSDVTCTLQGSPTLDVKHCHMAVSASFFTFHCCSKLIVLLPLTKFQCVWDLSWWFLLKHSTFRNQTWCGGVPSETGSVIQRIGLLSSRSRSYWRRLIISCARWQMLT